MQGIFSYRGGSRCKDTEMVHGASALSDTEDLCFRRLCHPKPDIMSMLTCTTAFSPVTFIFNRFPDGSPSCDQVLRQSSSRSAETASDAKVLLLSASVGFICIRSILHANTVLHSPSSLAGRCTSVRPMRSHIVSDLGALSALPAVRGPVSSPLLSPSSCSLLFSH